MNSISGQRVGLVVSWSWNSRALFRCLLFFSMLPSGGLSARSTNQDFRGSGATDRSVAAHPERGLATAAGVGILPRRTPRPNTGDPVEDELRSSSDRSGTRHRPRPGSIVGGLAVLSGRHATRPVEEVRSGLFAPDQSVAARPPLARPADGSVALVESEFYE